MEEDFSSFEPQNRKYQAGGWFFPLTLLSFVMVGGFSFLMCKLTGSVANRPIWLMGLVFAIPTGAMFLSAMLLEFATGKMTPDINRGGQVKVAIVATLLTFAVGCLCDAVYIYGGFIHQSQANVVFLIDRSYSMEGVRDREVQRVFGELLDKMDNQTEVGLVSFNHTILTEVPIAPLVPVQREQLEASAACPIGGGTGFYETIKTALRMVTVRNSKCSSRIILLTDGFEAIEEEYSLTWGPNKEEVLSQLESQKVPLYVIAVGSAVDNSLAELVRETGGKQLSTSDMNEVLDFMVTASKADGDMIRAATLSSTVLTGIMMLLEGLVIGFGMALMLSVRGQFRFQPILTLIMAVIGFVLMKIINLGNVSWQIEASAFSLLGVVIMRSNIKSGSKTAVHVANMPGKIDDGDF